jgi:hypothetical protein
MSTTLFTPATEPSEIYHERARGLIVLRGAFLSEDGVTVDHLQIRHTGEGFNTNPPSERSMEVLLPTLPNANPDFVEISSRGIFVQVVMRNCEDDEGADTFRFVADTPERAQAACRAFQRTLTPADERDVRFVGDWGSVVDFTGH